MARFSLAPPPIGNNSTKAVDVLGFPDIGEIKKVADGNIGIADKCFNGFFDKASAGLSGVTLDIFSKLSLPNLGGGLPALEAISLKSIFETQKPYIETVICTLGALVVVENVIAISKAGIEPQSLKPKTNDKSLYTKMQNLEPELEAVKKLTQPVPNSFSNFSEKDRINGLTTDDIDQAFEARDINITETSVEGNRIDWATVSSYYSTGNFIPEIPYTYTYVNIVETIKDNTPIPTPIPTIEDDDNAPTKIFDIWVDKLGDGETIERITDPKQLPNGWNIDPKWDGPWEGWSSNETIFKREYLKYIDTIVTEELKENGVTDKEVVDQITETVENAMPFNPGDNFFTQFKKASIFNQTYTHTQKVGDKSSKGFGNKLNSSNKFGYRPRKIDGNWINPETDYNLNIIRIDPSKTNLLKPKKDQEGVHGNNEQLSGDIPLVRNYSEEKVSDTLLKKDYSSKKSGDPASFYSGSDIAKNKIHRKKRWNNSKKLVRKTIPSPEDRYGEYVYVESLVTQFNDKGVFYVVEGVYKNRLDVAKQKGQGGGGEKYYRYGSSETRPGLSLAAATAAFAIFAATVLPCVIQSASLAIKTFNNPFNFVFETLMVKIGDGFEAFSPKLPSLFLKLKSIKLPGAKRKFISENPLLQKFISLDLDGNLRFIFDGAGIMALLGFAFGIGIKDSLPNMILDKNGLPSIACDDDKGALGGQPPDRGEDITGLPDDMKSVGGTIPQNNRVVDGTRYEIVNTEYSTGDYVEGLNYKYYYITLDNEALISKANAKVAKANEIKPQDPAEAINLKLQAMEDYQKASSKDPGNRYINDQMSELQKESGVQSNIVLQFLINLITLPIKIVLCIVDFILNFFTSLKVTELPAKILEFMSFDWILKYVKPSAVLELMGMKLNPDFIPLWAGQSLTFPSLFKFDMSQIFSAPFLGKLPTFNALQFPHTIKGGPKILLIMGGVFCFLEGLVNGILCFIMNVFNVDKVFVCPEMNLSRFTDETLSAEDIEKIVAEADFNFENQNSKNKFNDNQISNPAFVYDVVLDDGTKVKNLNDAELQAFIANNQNLKYKYNYNG